MDNLILNFIRFSLRLLRNSFESLNDSLVTMKLWFLFLVFTLMCFGISAQTPQVEPRTLDFGRIEEANSLNSYLVIRNTGSKALILLRADASPEFTISVGRKIIPSGDTLHLNFNFRPSRAAKFKETIKLYYNGSPEPLSIEVKGDIKKILAKDLSACVNFDPKSGSFSNGNASIPLMSKHSVRFMDTTTGKLIKEGSILYISQTSREKSERSTYDGLLESMIPIGPYAFVVTAPGYETIMMEKYIPMGGSKETFMLSPLPKPDTKTDSLQKEPLTEIPKQLDLSTLLDERVYKPNNIVFLIDISGSMKEPEKLPLLKQSMVKLMEPIRPIDKITIVTYGTDVRIAVPTVAGNEKKRVLELIDTLKASGVTAGSKGIQTAYTIAQEQFISGGNNQVILATDGAFRVNVKDRKMIEQSSKNPNQTTILSVIGFGCKPDALKMLGELTKQGAGSLIQVNNSNQAENALLDEIKNRSKR
jgi:Mg-chelatase subunit ChlD